MAMGVSNAKKRSITRISSEPPTLTLVIKHLIFRPLNHVLKTTSSKERIPSANIVFEAEQQIRVFFFVVKGDTYQSFDVHDTPDTYIQLDSGKCNQKHVYGSAGYNRK